MGYVPDKYLGTQGGQGGARKSLSSIVAGSPGGARGLFKNALGMADPTGASNPKGFGISPGAIMGLKRFGEQQSQLIGDQTTNRVRSGFASRGIPAAAILDASQRGARAQGEAAGQIGAATELGVATANQQGTQFGADLLNRIKLAQLGVDAAKAGKSKGISTPFGGISF